MKNYCKATFSAVLYSALITLSMSSFACENEFTSGAHEVNGISMHYEIHGSGKPLVMIHGNSGDMSDVRHLIPYYCDSYMVVIADGRGHGKTELNTHLLTYELMARDWNELLRQLEIDSAYVLGLSDGGVIGIKMAISNPQLVGKLVTFGANVSPPEASAYQWAIDQELQVSAHIADKIKNNDQSENWPQIKQAHNLLFSDPDISQQQLNTLQVPVFVMSSDMDVIRNEHTLYIFENLKNAHLAIVPGQTHFFPGHDPEGFSTLVKEFLDKEFYRPTTESFFFNVQ